MCEIAEALSTKELVAAVRQRVMEVTVGLSGVFLATATVTSPKARLAKFDRFTDEAAELASLKKPLIDLEAVAEKMEERRATVAAFVSKTDKR